MMEQNITQVHGMTKDELLQAINGVEEKLNNFEKNFQPKEPTEWITRKEVSEILSISLVTIASWSEKNILHPYRIGNRIRFKRKEVELALTKING
ncbi:MAG: helix-turn-helix domain-containing protein [Flavobacteriaceae bacterium]|nr:helix-turn-helix domain-containing protein [Flavobacteriaceae bacterium]MBL4905793.1 helix-turn-helix domain-containing protein [Flavobacteriaceae bacterium]